VKPSSTLGTVLSSAGIIAFFSILSRVLGLFRDRLLAGSFGAGQVLDAYYAAFKIPDFLFNLLVLGALTAAFVPVVGGYLVKKKKEEANKITSASINLLVMLMVVLSGLALIFTPQLVNLAAPGFVGDTRDLTIQLTRIMLVSPLIFGISSVVSSYLNTTRNFTAYAIAPVFYNLGIIVGVLWLVPSFGVQGLAYGVLLGASMHLLIQLPAMFKAGFRYSLRAPLKHPGVIKMLKLAGPRVVSIAAMQINIIVITAIASTFSEGAVATYNLAFNLQSLPLGIVGISIATAIFPFLAEAATKNDANSFITQVSQTIRQIFFLVIPMSLAFILLRVPIVRLVLGTGSFDFNDTFVTASLLGIFSISLFAQSVVPLLARGFYALEDTRTPVLISGGSIVINIVAAILLGRAYGVQGLVIAFSGAAVIDFLLHMILLRNRLGGLNDVAIFKTTVKIVVASALAGLALIGVRELYIFYIPLATFWAVFGQAALATGAGGLVYLIVHKLLKSEELGELMDVFKRRIGKKSATENKVQ